MTNSIWLLAVEAAEEGGGLFDFDATLPLMAVQFVLLAIILNAILYKPLGKALDDRDSYILSSGFEAKERLTKAEQLAKQYEQELSETRRQAKNIINEAQEAAQKIAAQSIAEAQQEAQSQREEAQRDLDEQKQAAFSVLENQVDNLGNQILDKLLSTAR